MILHYPFREQRDVLLIITIHCCAALHLGLPSFTLYLEAGRQRKLYIIQVVPIKVQLFQCKFAEIASNNLGKKGRKEFFFCLSQSSFFFGNFLQLQTVQKKVVKIEK